MSSPAIVDLFAGPGGWDEGLAQLGRTDVLGIEWDDAACATRAARGHATRQGDIATIDPLEYEGIDGLIASPPCQAWSMAGKRLGEQDRPLVLEAIRDLGAGDDTRHELGERCSDPRTMLAAEPARWAIALRPRWIACEQVPPALELWEATAAVLRDHGYDAWVGLLRAEQYGVPQTRKRAFLIARRDGIDAAPPPPTHRRYVAPRSRSAEGGGLFDLPDPTAIVQPGEEHLKPWVSMNEALGWGFAAEPAPTLSGGGEGTTASACSPAPRSANDSAPRCAMRANAQANSAVRSMDEPAPTIKGGHDYNDRTWVLRTGQNSRVSRTDPDGTEPYERDTTEPAPTVMANTDRWSYNARDQRDGRTGKPNRMRAEDEPAPTICAESRNDTWTADPPAAKVPRVTEAEAAVLQTFPADYPWQGNKGKRFEQIGNAVPPLLARAVLASILTPERKAHDQ